jgi:hypothetical protein
MKHVLTSTSRQAGKGMLYSFFLFITEQESTLTALLLDSVDSCDPRDSMALPPGCGLCLGHLILWCSDAAVQPSTSPWLLASAMTAIPECALASVGHKRLSEESKSCETGTSVLSWYSEEALLWQCVAQGQMRHSLLWLVNSSWSDKAWEVGI